MSEEKVEKKQNLPSWIPPEEAERLESLKPLTFEQHKDYLIPKTIGLTTTGSIIGAATGYYLGERLAMNFYGFGLGFGLIGTSFYGFQNTAAHFRGKEDYKNYAASGLFHGLVFTVPFAGIKRGLVGGIAGLVFGAVYGVTSMYLYDNGRSAWIANRRRLIATSEVKKPHEQPLHFESRSKTHEQFKPERKETDFTLKIKHVFDYVFGDDSDSKGK